MSGDTSGACCQGKLSYPAMSAPFPQTHTHTHTHTWRLPTFPPTPREKRRPEGRGDDGAVDREVDLHSLRTSATTWLLFLFAKCQGVGFFFFSTDDPRLG